VVASARYQTYGAEFDTKPEGVAPEPSKVSHVKEPLAVVL
jgi:hypothetical protein